jgi:Fe-S cluster biogenesis protein NfuA/Fe-S cluster assembly iron-binding protein IscA
MSAPTVTLTDLAKQKLDEYLSEEPSDTVVRVLVEDDGKFGLSLDQKDDSDVEFEVESIAFVVEGAQAECMEGLRIDYLEQGATSGFSLTGGKAPQRKTVLRTEDTPNPDARKFILSFSLGAASKTWEPEDEDVPAPLAKVLALEGVASLFQLNTFITVTREATTDWSDLTPKVIESLNEMKPGEVNAAHNYGDGDSLFERVGRFIVTDVAPFLQADGGDIELVTIDEEGICHVRLVGACGTCPSSVATLQMGVDRRLKENFPDEVKGLKLADPATV